MEVNNSNNGHNNNGHKMNEKNTVIGRVTQVDNDMNFTKKDNDINPNNRDSSSSNHNTTTVGVNSHYIILCAQEKTLA